MAESLAIFINTLLGFSESNKVAFLKVTKSLYIIHRLTQRLTQIFTLLKETSPKLVFLGGVVLC